MERLSRPEVTPGINGGEDAKRYIMALLNQDEGTPVVPKKKTRISSIAASVKVGDSAPVVASVVKFGGGDGGDGGKGGSNDGADELSKSKVGAAPNMGACSPVSLAAILRKAG